MILRSRILMVAIVLTLASLSRAEQPPEGGYEVHDKRRPQPVVVTPPTASTQDQAGKAPADAKVLFDGGDLSRWTGAKGEDAPWKVVDGVIESVPHTGNIQSKDQFADGQYHIEWMELPGTQGKSQGRGNSGFFIMGLYELQVLDNYQAETYADGMAGSIYGQYPPLANATRPQGQWQTYDVVFHAPKYQEGKVVQPATETVFFNGVLVHDNVQLLGPTGHQKLAKYPDEHPAKGPVQLQDHGNPVRFRNIWVREIPAKADQPQPPTKPSGENFYEKH